MAATRYDFPELRQGETWDHALELYDSAGALVNLTGATARLTIRANVGFDSTLLTDGDLTSASGLTLGGALGTVTPLRTATQTRAWAPGRYQYELKIKFADGKTRASVAGILPVIAGVAEAPP